MKERYTIEVGHGETYHQREGVTVYKHDRYPRGSVLAGQDRRTFVDTFESVEAAKAAFPKATDLTQVGSTHRPVADVVRHLPDDTDY